MDRGNQLWYDQPAAVWEEALPIGNGRLGGMVFGGFSKERIALNDDSIWYGAYRDRVNQEAQENLEAIRKLIFEGKIKEAERLLLYSFSGTPDCQRIYQPLGNLIINYHQECEMQDYCRKLDLERGIITVTATCDNRKIRKEYFASHPDGVIMILIQVVEGDAISFDVSLSRDKFYDTTGKVNDHLVYMDGSLGKDGFEFCAAVGATSTDGKITTMGKYLVIEQASQVCLVMSSGCTFYESDHYHKACYDKVEQALEKGYQRCLESHVSDYRNLYDRVEFQLSGDQDWSYLPTDQRLRRLSQDEEDVGLVALYFNYARYLMISGSRPGSQPLNLQGIWNESMQPSWDSKYTININTEMNYWMTESCNLSECHLPLFDLLKRAVENGKETARKMYGCRGFVIHHNLDIYGDTAPQDEFIPGTYWPMGGAWLCTHLYEHYRYTQDLDWLKTQTYPIIREAVLFFLDFLVEKDGRFLTCPSLSPENTYCTSQGELGHACAAPSMDNSILRDLFDQFEEVAKLLDVDEEMRYEVLKRRLGLPPLAIGSDGRLLEWDGEYEEANPGHRHISHLYALYPSNQISIKNTPELAQAARKTLDFRMEHGGGYTGWSCAWTICFYARLQDQERAYQMVLKLLKESTFPNLMDNHPMKNGYVFQIDGNLGACAGIIEMLVQMQENLTGKKTSSLPKSWKNGMIKGVKLQDGGTLNLIWENGLVIKVGSDS